MGRALLVVDDRMVVRKGLKTIFASCDDHVVAGEAQTRAAPRRSVRVRAFDGVVLDLTLPDRGGLDVLCRMTRLRPRMPVIALTAHPAERYAEMARTAGARGYLVKGAPADEIVRATRRVLAGATHFQDAPPSTGRRSGRRDAHEHLSPREFEIFLEFAAGLTSAQIAERYCLSVNTVTTHRSRILDKMRLRSNADLSYYAMTSLLIM